MKKTVKRILSVILALIIACISPVAFALENAEVVKWYLYDLEADEETYYEEYHYAGDISVGTTNVGDYLNVSSYYNFNAEKTGYYLISFEPGSFIYARFPQKHDSSAAYGMKECMELYDEGVLIYYLTEGETLLFVDCFEETEISIEYAGEAITDLAFDESQLNNLILDYDIYCNYETKEAILYNMAGAVVFSSGKTVEFGDAYFICTYEGEVPSSSNMINLELFEYSEQLVVSICTVTDYVESIEMSNVESYTTVYEYYTGEHEVPEIGEETLTVTYTDGTTHVYDFNGGYAEIELPNGRSYAAETIGWYNALELYLADRLYAEYEYTVEKADFDANIKALQANNRYWINRANSDASYRLNRISNSADFSQKLVLFLGIPGLYSNALFQIICNIVEFMEYYSADVSAFAII